MSQCTATSKQTHDRCRQPASSGATVCRFHGGASPQVRRKAAERLADEAAVKAMRRFGEPIDTSPTEALLDTVRWTAGYVAWLREKVGGAADDDALAVGTDPSVWVRLLGDWSDKLVRVCAEAIRANIDERRVRLAEAQGALVADVIRTILGRLDLSPEQTATAGEVVPFELRRLAS